MKMPPRDDANATMRQSGENAGSWLLPWPCVRRVYAPVFKFRVKMSNAPPAIR